MNTAIVWFRRDLRLVDNPALNLALEACERVIPLYIHSPEEEAPWQPGAASNWWLHHSLRCLDRSLRALGSGLVILRGGSLEALRAAARRGAVTHVYWNRLYEPASVARDRAIKQGLREDGLRAESCNGSLLFEPWDVRTGDGGPFRVFTPFWKACLRKRPQARPLPPPQGIPAVPAGLESLALDALRLLPVIPWDAGLAQSWRVGEAAAAESVDRFLDQGLAAYDEGRNRPGIRGTSRLSPHLHFGEISPRSLLSAVRARAPEPGETAGGTGPGVFLSEIGWREFAHHLVYHFPHTPEAPMDRRFEDFPWAADYQQDLAHWQAGRTGIPIVDAGMRELWQTGWMHNRVRMIVASLLTKNLLVPWQEGARWFWDTLVDADLAANSLGWQWTAGCGADAAPYFRIFNPVLQGERYDPDGAYVRRWVPEIAGLPDRFLHKPWEAPADVRLEAGVALGESYPKPLVDLKESRKRALERFERVKA